MRKVPANFKFKQSKFFHFKLFYELLRSSFEI